MPNSHPAYTRIGHPLLPPQWEVSDDSKGPEWQLFKAILDTALNDLKYPTATARVWFEATDWVWPCSFVRVCEVIGVDAERLRKNLRQRNWIWRPGQRAKSSYGHRGRHRLDVG